MIYTYSNTKYKPTKINKIPKDVKPYKIMENIAGIKFTKVSTQLTKLMNAPTPIQTKPVKSLLAFFNRRYSFK